MTRSSLRIALLAIVSLASAHAHAQFTSDIDLVWDDQLVHYSQTDFRWGSYPVGPARQRLIEDCGCLLAAFATVMNHQGRGMMPWYPTALASGTSAFDFNPRYLDLYLLIGPNLAAPRAPGWAYKNTGDPQFCGTSPLISALRGVGFDGLSAALGFKAVVRRGNGANVKRTIDANLRNGLPTVIVRKVTRGANNSTTHHVFVVAGWDNDVKAYRVLDPMSPRAGLAGVYRPQVPVAAPSGNPSGDQTYANWWAGVEGIIDLKPANSQGGLNAFIFGDDPSPIEIVMTEPNGLRTGYDPASTTEYESDESGASYWSFGPFTAPLDDGDEAGVEPRYITYPGAPDGRYYFKVTGVADGPLQLSAETLLGGARTLLAEYTGSIAAGEVRKYELDYARAGASVVRLVTNFSPRAEAGEDRNGRTDFPLAFDGRRSFDADGAINSYSWEFGDGTFATGAQPQHVYSVPGSYTVRLTVTDANGVVASDTLRAEVVLSQRAPVAHASGPYVGFVSTPVLPYPVFLDARGSSDPNGEALTYRWSFGDGSPDAVTTTPFTTHTYAELGEHALTVVVNDGIDDSAPATTTVTIYTAPTSPPFGIIEDELIPNCGRPGDTVTLVLGEFARFDSWNLGTQGALPPLPTNLPVGVSAPPGLVGVGFGNAWFEDLPFEARLLSPGRYLAEVRFVVPNVRSGTHNVLWGEGDAVPFRVPCPLPANGPPTADAGGPYAGAVGAPIQFDGSASFDPEDDYLTYEWHFGDGAIDVGPDPEHTYAAEGTYLVTLIVSDGENSSQATTGGFAAVVVSSGSADTIPPVTTAVQDPPVNSGWSKTPVTVELNAADNPGGSGVRDIAFALSGAESGASVVPGDTVSIGIARDGLTTVQFFATDHAGNQEAPQQHVVRIDRTGPAIAGMPAPGCTLWPPNHKLVRIASISATDLGAGLLPGSLKVSATSSEVADGRGDGGTATDIVIDGGNVSVRPERSGRGTGRTYTIVAEAMDLAGNTARVQGTCVVPHDKGH